MRPIFFITNSARYGTYKSLRIASSNLFSSSFLLLPPHVPPTLKSSVKISVFQSQLRMSHISVLDLFPIRSQKTKVRTLSGQNLLGVKNQTKYRNGHVLEYHMKVLSGLTLSLKDKILDPKQAKLTWFENSNKVSIEMSVLPIALDFGFSLVLGSKKFHSWNGQTEIGWKNWTKYRNEN